jgi:hypothetical protein
MCFEGIIEVNLPSPSSTLWVNPRSMDRMKAVQCSYVVPPWDINLGGVHRCEGPMVGFLEEHSLFVAHQLVQLSAAYHSGVSVVVVP